MRFDLSNTCQSAIYFEDIKVKVKVNEKLIAFSKKHTNIARFTGLPIALCYSLLNIAKSVSGVAESVIKGIVNILGAPFSEECNFLNGLKQLFVQFPVHISHTITGFAVLTVCEILTTPVFMLISPTSALEEKKRQAEQTKQILTAVSKNQSIVVVAQNAVQTNLLKVHMFGMKLMYA